MGSKMRPILIRVRIAAVTLVLPGRLERNWAIMSSRKMLLLAPYCFHIGVAIGFTIYFNTIITDNKAVGVIGLYNCVGGEPSPQLFAPPITTHPFHLCLA